MLIGYPLAPVLAPFLGIFWVLNSNNVNAGKLFLIYNALSILNYGLGAIGSEKTFFIIGIVIKIFSSYIGCHYLSYLENLNDITFETEENQ